MEEEERNLEVGWLAEHHPIVVVAAVGRAVVPTADAVDVVLEVERRIADALVEIRDYTGSKQDCMLTIGRFDVDVEDIGYNFPGVVAEADCTRSRSRHTTAVATCKTVALVQW